MKKCGLRFTERKVCLRSIFIFFSVILRDQTPASLHTSS